MGVWLTVALGASTVKVSSSPQVFLVGTDGRGLHQLTGGRTSHSNAIWLPSGARVASITDDGNNVWVEAERANGTGRTVVSIKVHSPNVQAGLAYSPTSGLTAVQTFNENTVTTTLEVVGTRRWQRHVLDTYLDCHPPDTPAWSPNGTLIAYDRPPPTSLKPAQLCAANSKAADSGHIVVVWRDGRNRRVLTAGPDRDLSPLFSPNGRSILFYRTDPQSYGALYTVSTSGGSIRRISPTLLDAWPAWSPDGTRVAFAGVVAHGDGKYYLYVLDVRTRRLRRLAGPVQTVAPSWSPDGREIAFAPYPGTLEVIAANGTSAHVIADVPGAQTDDLAWSPTGATIALTLSKAPTGD
jgi:Tol biopolymer transport system component